VNSEEKFMNVQITEKKTGKHIGVFPINLGGSLGQSESEYFDEAWRCAVEDRLVAPGDRAAYDFQLLAD
jgi:hypothetical protein